MDTQSKIEHLLKRQTLADKFIEEVAYQCASATYHAAKMRTRYGGTYYHYLAHGQRYQAILTAQNFLRISPTHRKDFGVWTRHHLNRIRALV